MPDYSSSYPLNNSIDQKREEAIDFLTDCFARDILTTSEYEKRVEGVHAAGSPVEIDTLLEDLRRTSTPANVNSGRDITAGRDTQRLIAVLGSQHLKGDWLKKDNVLIQTVLGSMRCDLREVRLFAVNRIQIYSFMAEIKIIVPPGVALVSNVSPILAEIKRKDRNPEQLPGAPVIEIGGLAIMSEVKIVTG